MILPVKILATILLASLGKYESHDRINHNKRALIKVDVHMTVTHPFFPLDPQDRHSSIFIQRV